MKIPTEGGNLAAPYDSLLTHPAPSPLQATEWWGAGSGMPDIDVGGQLRTATLADQTWVVCVVLAMLLALFAAWCGSRQYLAYRVKDFFGSSRQFSNMDSGGTAAGRGLLHLVLLLTSWAGIGLLGCTHLGQVRLPDTYTPALQLQEPQHAFLVLTALVALLWTLKTAAYGIVNWTFFAPKANRSWQSAWVLLTSLAAAPLFLLCVLQVFIPVPASKVSICALILFILYKFAIYFKLKTNFQAKKYGNLLLLLYLCTLEIAPAVAAWHFIETHSTT